MSDRWTIRGLEFGTCNCDWGCPCQFNAPTTHGNCQAVVGGIVEEGHFNETRLDGLRWALVLYWPGEIAEGNGRQQAFIDEHADADQREALRRILHGESTAPGATHFFVYNSTMSEVLDPIYAPIDVAIDVDARKGHVRVAAQIESEGSPLINPNSGHEHRAAIHLPFGFEYTTAEMGTGTSRSTGAIAIEQSDSYAQFNVLHMNQDGVIR